MKKKIGIIIGLAAVSGLAWGANLQFVTTLSSPLGTFAQLETADPSALTSVPLVNFCNTRAPAGTIAVKGANAYITELTLKNGATLGGNAPEMRISSALNVNNGGTLEGGRLLGGSASVSGASSAKSKVDNSLYVSSIKVKGAKTANLNIPSQVQTSGSGDGTALEWSNAYNKDYYNNGQSSGGGTYTSYLLKSKGAFVVDPDPEPLPEPSTYYFKCVSRVQTSGGVAMGQYSSLEEAQSACLSGEDTGASFMKYLSGGMPDPNCRPPAGQSCAIQPAYYIKYQCSTEPPQPCSGYGFCEQNCMVVQPHA